MSHIFIEVNKRRHFAYKTAAIRAKWIIFVLLAMEVLALWSDSEPVLPAYVIGMLLAKTMEKDAILCAD